MSEKTFEQMAQENAVAIAGIRSDLISLREKVNEGFHNVREDIKNLECSFVTRAEFKPYQVILGIIGTGLLGYMVKAFFEKITG